MKVNSLYVVYGDNGNEMAYRIMEEAGVSKIVNSSMKLAIKPNLVVPKPHTSGATTSPGVVEGIIRFLKDCGCGDISIMEGSWIGSDTSRAFEACGYVGISKKYGVRLIDLKKDKTKTISLDGKSVTVCRSPLEADFLINVPVLKAHCQTLLTCALKNLKGCIPDSEKRRFHAHGLHENIALLNAFLKAHLVIVDGITGDLTFEEGGNPVHMNRIILGTDPVMVDSYAARLIGYSPDDIRYIGLAERLGIGKSAIGKDCVNELNRELNQELNRYGSKGIANTGSKVRCLSRRINEKQACSACYGSLVHALCRLEERGILKEIRADIHIGQGFKGLRSDGISVGNCTRGFTVNIPGCPPDAADIVRTLTEKYHGHNS
jgi:uncharacterized protein (DUF362 family)